VHKQDLTPEAFLQNRSHRTILDVRSPSEYIYGHIPGAISFPLFDDAERAEVGTLYKQHSPEAALLRGLELAGAKMRGYVEDALRLAPQKKVGIYCWRGGQRSGSMCWLLSQAGFDVVRLSGGYKEYRHWILDQFEKKECKLIILGGKTGSGKTQILQCLKNLGEQIMDLEARAHHKGSAFGNLGEQAQPSYEQFSNDLFEDFAGLDSSRPVWLESESKAIGTVQIPTPLWLRICHAPMIELEVNLEQRIQNLVSLYSVYPQEQLAASFQKIAKRLGGVRLKEALEAVHSKNYAEAVSIALTYYDKSYRVSLDAMNRGQLHILKCSHFDPIEIARRLLLMKSKISNDPS
jgi:tRNA 2-selenouridine synthase